MTNKNRLNIDELMEGFEHVCRAKGLKLTHQRTEIFQEMANFPGHPTAENVFSRVRERLKTISLDTVYRTISTFEKHGLIKRVQMFDNSARFDINLSVHHHLICTRCHKIEDFYWPDFDQMRLPTVISGWSKIESRHVEIRGLCHDCELKSKQ